VQLFSADMYGIFVTDFNKGTHTGRYLRYDSNNMMVQLAYNDSTLCF